MTDAAEPLSPLVQSQLQILKELAAFGLDVARAVSEEAKAEPSPQRRPAGDLALAYARVSRAVRLTLMLQSRLVGEQEQAAIARDNHRHLEQEARKARVEQVIERLAEAEHPHDEDAVDALLIEAGERLDDDRLYADLMDRPIHEIAQRICRDLGLTATRPLPLAGEGDPEGVERAFGSNALQCTPMPSLSASLTSLPPAGETAMAWPPPPPTEGPAPAPLPGWF